MIDWKKIRLISYDFDGVMTDNKVYVSQNGNESIKVNRSDGLAVSEFKNKGILQIIISTEANPVVQERAKKLAIPSFTGIANKKDALTSYCSDKKISPQASIFVGNEINDIEVMQSCKWSLCPADAHPKVKEISTLVLGSNGGEGVVREILDIYLSKIEIQK